MSAKKAITTTERPIALMTMPRDLHRLLLLFSSASSEVSYTGTPNNKSRQRSFLEVCIGRTRPGSWVFEGKFDGLLGGLAAIGLFFLGRGGVGENQSVDDVDSGGVDPDDVVEVDDCVSLVVAVVASVVVAEEDEGGDDEDDVVVDVDDVVLASFKVTGGMSRGLLKNWKAH